MYKNNFNRITLEDLFDYELPEIKLYNHIVKKNYLNDYSRFENNSYEDNLEIINQDIEDFNNHVEYLNNKDLHTQRDNKKYKSLLIKLQADKDYLNKEFENNLFNDFKELFNIPLPSLSQIRTIEDLERFNLYDFSIKDYSNLSLKEVYKQLSDLIVIHNSFIISLNKKNISDTYSLSKEDYKKYKDIVIQLNDLVKYFNKTKIKQIEFDKKYNIELVFSEDYSTLFNDMLYNYFIEKYSLFKIENINKKNVFMMFKYYYNPDEYHTSPITNSNFNVVEEFLSGKTCDEIELENPYYQASDPEIVTSEKPIVELLYEFEFINNYSKNSLSSEILNQADSKKVNREGQLFPYKINILKFKEYFKKYTDIVIKYLNRYQIFENYNESRNEYRYNCLIYSLFIYFKDKLGSELSEKVCNQLSQFNCSRLTTLSDIKKINKYFNDKKDIFKKRYKICLYKYDYKNSQVKTNYDNKDKSDYEKINICLIESKGMNESLINHFIIYEHPNFKSELLEMIYQIPKIKSNNRNYNDITSYQLIKILLENDFFIPFNNSELKDILDEEDVLKKSIKNKELHEILNVTDNQEILSCQNVFSKPKDNKTNEDKNKINVPDQVRKTLINEYLENKGKKYLNEYDHVCFFDFEAYIDEKHIHRPYSVSYIIFDETQKIDLNVNKKDIKHIFGFDCDKKFLDIIPNKTLCYSHNIKYDITMFNLNDITVKKACEKSSNIYSRTIDYNQKEITFKDSYKILPYKLAELPTKLGLSKDVEKEVFPYDFYNYHNLTNYADTNFDFNHSNEDSKEIMLELRKSFKSNSKYMKFKRNIFKYFDGIFNMKKYEEYYCNKDVEVLSKSMLKIRENVYNTMMADIFNYLTTPSLAYEYFRQNVYNKADIYKYSGIVREYIQSAVYGGVCTGYKNALLIIHRMLCDFDAVSLYPSAMKRLYLVTGKCNKFTYDEIKMINNSMKNGEKDYCNKNCVLYTNTNKENENNENKLNAYIVTVLIKKSNKVYNNPRIIVKNEKYNGKLKYPNLKEGNICVNVDPNVNLEDPLKKDLYVKECVVTIDNIMLEDYINFHDIEFEVLAGIYWGNMNYCSIYNCHKKINELNIKSIQIKNKIDKECEINLIDEETIRMLWKNESSLNEDIKIIYNDIKSKINEYKNIQSEIKKYLDRLELLLDKYNKNKEYNDITEEINNINDEIKLLKKNKVKNVKIIKDIKDLKNKLKECDKKMCELDHQYDENKSIKDYTIRNVIENVFSERLKVKKSAPAQAELYKLIMNSTYGKTIQKPTTKNIKYLKSKNVLTFEKNDENNKLLKKIKKIMNKCKRQYLLMKKYNEITEDEYTNRINELKNCLIEDEHNYYYEYSPYTEYLIDNKNKIINDEIINEIDDIHRVETIEQTFGYETLTLLGVQILSMSKRIMNEVICLAQDNNINIYYQDTDSMHIEKNKIPLLSNLFKEKYNRDLIGEQLGQFHSDFNTFELWNGNKNNETCSYLCIVCGKKIYNDILENVEYIDFINKLKKKDLNKLNDHQIIEIWESCGYKMSFKKFCDHLRMKGIPNKVVKKTAKKMKISRFKLYFKLLLGEKIMFNLSAYTPRFKMNHDQTTVSYVLKRELKTKGAIYIFTDDDKEYVYENSVYSSNNFEDNLFNDFKSLFDKAEIEHLFDKIENDINEIKLIKNKIIKHLTLIELKNKFKN